MGNPFPGPFRAQGKEKPACGTGKVTRGSTEGHKLRRHRQLSYRLFAWVRAGAFFCSWGFTALGFPARTLRLTFFPLGSISRSRWAKMVLCPVREGERYATPVKQSVAPKYRCRVWSDD